MAQIRLTRWWFWPGCFVKQQPREAIASVIHILACQSWRTPILCTLRVEHLIILVVKRALAAGWADTKPPRLFHQPPGGSLRKIKGRGLAQARAYSRAVPALLPVLCHPCDQKAEVVALNQGAHQESARMEPLGCHWRTVTSQPVWLKSVHDKPEP